MLLFIVSKFVLSTVLDIHLRVPKLLALTAMLIYILPTVPPNLCEHLNKHISKANHKVTDDPRRASYVIGDSATVWPEDIKDSQKILVAHPQECRCSNAPACAFSNASLQRVRGRFRTRQDKIVLSLMAFLMEAKDPLLNAA